jgi:serine/threonine protein kinase
VLDLMEQICAGVGVTHAHNMVHRDLKPSNVFLATLSGDVVAVKILDFGIAKALGDDENLTQNGVMMGSSGSMSPEQIHGLSEIDARSDVYALGALLYFMLAGKPAYAGNTRAVVTRQMLEPPAPIDFDALGKPEAAPLMPVILKAMAREPEDRFHSAEELMQALREACDLPEPATGTRLRPQDLPDGGGEAKSTVVPAARTGTGSASGSRPRSPSGVLRAPGRRRPRGRPSRGPGPACTSPSPPCWPAPSPPASTSCRRRATARPRRPGTARPGRRRRARARPSAASARTRSSWA